MLLLLTIFAFSLCIFKCREYEQGGEGTSVVTGNTEFWSFLVLLLLNIFPLLQVILKNSMSWVFTIYSKSNPLFGKKCSVFGQIDYSENLCWSYSSGKEYSIFPFWEKLCAYRKVPLVNQTWPRKGEGFFPTDTFIFHDVVGSQDPAARWCFNARHRCIFRRVWVEYETRRGGMWCGDWVPQKKQRQGAQRRAHPGSCMWSSPLIKGAEKGMAKGFVH